MNSGNDQLPVGLKSQLLASAMHQSHRGLSSGLHFAKCLSLEQSRNCDITSNFVLYFTPLFEHITVIEKDHLGDWSPEKDCF